MDINGISLGEYEAQYETEKAAIDTMYADYAQALKEEEESRLQRWEDLVNKDIQESGRILSDLNAQLAACRLFDVKKKQTLSKELTLQKQRIQQLEEERKQKDVVKKRIHRTAYAASWRFQARCSRYLEVVRKRLLAQTNADLKNVIACEDVLEQILEENGGYPSTADDLIIALKKKKPDYLKMNSAWSESKDSVVQSYSNNILTLLTDLLYLGRVGYYSGEYNKPYKRYYYSTELKGQRILPPDVDDVFSYDARSRIAEEIAYKTEKEMGDGFSSFIQELAKKFGLYGLYDSTVKYLNEEVRKSTVASMQRVLAAKAAVYDSHKVSPALAGGIVNGLFGPVAGLVVAYSAMNENQKKERNRVLDELARDEYRLKQEEADSAVSTAVKKLRLIEYYIICLERKETPVVRFEDITDSDNPIYVSLHFA